MRRAVLLPGAVLSLVALLALPALVRPGAARGQAASSDPVALARAFTAAWNAHDAEAVVALFWSDATVRQTGAAVLLADDRDGTPATALVEDAFGAGRRRPAEAPDGRDARAWSGGEVLWAAGAPRIRVWAAAHFAAGHRVEASGYRAEGDTVTWRYRASADPYQRFAGVEPAEGTAEVVARAGRIAALAFASDGETVARRERQFEAALNARSAAAWAAAARGGPPRPPSPPAAAPAAAEAPDPRLPLGLAGAAALAGLLAARRRGGRSG